MVLIKNIDIQVLLVDRRDQDELLPPMVHAHMLLIVEPFCPSVHEVTPLRVPSIH